MKLHKYFKFLSYRRELVRSDPPLGRAVIKSNIEQKVYKTYEVKEDRVSEDDWKTFKVKLEDYAKSFWENIILQCLLTLSLDY